MKIILASASPRRRELLTLAGIEHEVVVANADESISSSLTPEEAATTVARRKARAVFETRHSDCVIGADTIVVLENEIFGKPQSEQDAFRMLKALSGKRHSVLTGVCIACGDKETVFCQKSLVEFYDLSDEDIFAYLSSGEPMDKAGAYAIQGKGCLFVKEIHGDYFNIVGLPVAALAKELNANHWPEADF